MEIIRSDSTDLFTDLSARKHSSKMILSIAITKISMYTIH